MKVIIIDQDPSVMTVLPEMIKRITGSSPTIYQDSIPALDHLRKTDDEGEWILIAQKMPEFGGIDFIRTLQQIRRKNHKMRKLARVALLSSDPPGDFLAYQRKIAIPFDILQKPFSIHTLNDLLNTAPDKPYVRKDTVQLSAGRRFRRMDPAPGDRSKRMPPQSRAR